MGFINVKVSCCFYKIYNVYNKYYVVKIMFYWIMCMWFKLEVTLFFTVNINKFAGL